MKKLKNYGKSTTVWLMSMAVSIPLMGQEESTENDPVFELSPFEVQTSNVGWNATETTAGSRLRQDVRDLSAQIEVMTMEFMDDMGVTNVEEALQYTSNVDGIYNYQDMSNGIDFGITNMTNVMRIRGMSGSGLSHDFFKGYTRTDNYNLSHLTIASGPSAILFGLGNPSGVVNTSFKRAMMRDNYTAKLLFDSNETQRYNLEMNKVLIKNKLAVNLAYLNEERHYEREPSWRDSERWYASVKYKPFKNTTINAMIEDAKIDSVGLVTLLPQDKFSSVVRKEGDTYGDELTSVNGYSWVPFADHDGWEMLSYDNQLLSNYKMPVVKNPEYVLSSNGTMPRYIVGDMGLSGFINGGSEYAGMDVRAKTGYVKPQNNVYQTNAFKFYNPQHLDPDTGLPLEGFVPTKKGQVTLISLLTPTLTPELAGLLPDADVNMMGTSRLIVNDSTTKSIFLEQKLTDTWYVELAFNKEDFFQKIDAMQWGNGQQPELDINENVVLYNEGTGQMEVAPNPYYGQFYTERESNFNFVERGREDFRATTSYELNVGDFWDGFLGNILGHHNFAGMYGHEKSWSRAQGTKRWLDTTDDETAGLVLPKINNNGNVANQATNANNVKSMDVANWLVKGNYRRPTVRTYLNDANPVANAYGEFFQPISMGSYVAYPGHMIPESMAPSIFQHQDLNWDDGNNPDYLSVSDLDYRRYTGISATNASKIVDDSFLFAWQGFFWDDRLMLLYGYRRDEANTATADRDEAFEQDYYYEWLPKGGMDQPTKLDANGNSVPDLSLVSGSGLYRDYTTVGFSEYGDKEIGTNENIGFIVRPFEQVTLGYNQSATTELSQANYEPNGQNIKGPEGEGKDMHIRYDLPEKNMWFKLNYYENTVTGDTMSWKITNALRSELRVFLQEFGEYYSTPINSASSDDTFLDPTGLIVHTEAPASVTQPLYSSYFDGFEFPSRTNNVGSQYPIRQDTESSGYELTFNWSPSRNWNIRINGSKKDVMISNAGGTWLTNLYEEYGEMRSILEAAAPGLEGTPYIIYNDDGTPREDMHGDPLNPTPLYVTNLLDDPIGNFTDSNGDPISFNERWADYIEPSALGKISSFDGLRSQQSTNWRGNLIVQYNFTEGMFKGWKVNTAFKYRSAPLIGYGLNLDGLSYNPDIEIEGEDFFNMDFTLTYSGKADWWGGFNYTVQFKVTNLLDMDEYIPRLATTYPPNHDLAGDVFVTRWGYNEPTIFQVAFTIRM